MFFSFSGTPLATRACMMKGLRIRIEKLRPILPRIEFLVALIITLHQFVMASPMHGQIMPMLVADSHASALMHGPCTVPCPMRIATICPVIQAALPAAADTILLLLAITLIVPLFVALMRANVAGQTNWHPPSKRQRDLIQVFRC